MNVKFIAHRGLSEHYPENTHLAFQKSWETGCDGIELDIHITKDNQAVVIHDPDTTRTAGEKHIIADSYYGDLRHLNVGKAGGEGIDERIPLLSDVIANMPVGKLVQVEIKHQIENMDAVMDALKNLRTDIVVQIISFDPGKLLRVRRELPQLACFLVMDAETPPLENRLAFAVENGLTGLDMDYQMATPEYVQESLSAGLQLAHWTINDVALAKKLIAQGAQFLASDIADELKGALCN